MSNEGFGVDRVVFVKQINMARKEEKNVYSEEKGMIIEDRRRKK